MTMRGQGLCRCALAAFWLVMGCAAVLADEARVVRRTGSLRQGPGSYYPVLMSLEPGMRVKVLESRGGWLRGTIGDQAGWMPRLTFEEPRAGVDYTGLLHSEKAVVISSVDIAAATKGAFESNYADTHKADFERVDAVEARILPPALVERIQEGLPTVGPSLLKGLPAPVFANNVIIRPDAEQLLGRALAATLMNAGLIPESPVSDYVNAVAAVVGAQTPRYDLAFRVAVTEDASMNGFGLPGGKIVLTRGLLNSVRNEAELACLLGHEIAHVTRYHGLREFQKRAPQRRRDSAFAELDAETAGPEDDPFAELNALTGETSRPGVEADLTRLANTSYLKIIGQRAREDEFEADLFGAAYAAAAGYDPQAMVTYLERVRDQGVGQDEFRHHPPVQDRIDALRQGIRMYRLASGPGVLHADRLTSEWAALGSGEDPR